LLELAVLFHIAWFHSFIWSFRSVILVVFFLSGDYLVEFLVASFQFAISVCSIGRGFTGAVISSVSLVADLLAVAILMCFLGYEIIDDGGFIV
jgi:hypothetical protein